MDKWVDGGPQQDGNSTDTETALSQCFHRRLQWFVGNVHGMDQYWQQQCTSFKATILYHSYIHGAMPNLFHTVSHAEFHDPFLCHLMAKYVSAVADDPDIGMAVLTDDSKYHHAIYDFKHVVTHFLVAKLEMWIVTFLSPLLGLQHILGSTEFGSSHGAIHFHLLGYTASPADEAIDNASHEILEKAELRHLKSERELSLYHRIVNMTNQSFCHCCSDYCWQKYELSVPFDPQQHNEAQVQTYTDARNGIFMACVPHYECWFGYGHKQSYNPSGHGNLTEGMPFVGVPYISMDGNQHPRLVCERNHPQTLQQPVATFYWVPTVTSREYWPTGAPCLKLMIMGSLQSLCQGYD
jgi:hypothetical protein